VSPGSRALAERLGQAGLIPFVLGTALVWLFGGEYPEQHRFVAFALAAYAGLILSFLGGIHWGLAFRAGEPGAQPLVWGISASLLAWVGVLMPPYAGLALLGMALVAAYGVDRRAYPALGAADWLTLRFRLTLVASLSCFLAAAGS
jgi:hypothetical protein